MNGWIDGGTHEPLNALADSLQNSALKKWEISDLSALHICCFAPEQDIQGPTARTASTDGAPAFFGCNGLVSGVSYRDHVDQGYSLQMSTRCPTISLAQTYKDTWVASRFGC